MYKTATTKNKLNHINIKAKKKHLFQPPYIIQQQSCVGSSTYTLKYDIRISKRAK